MKNLVEEVKAVRGFDDGINIVKKYKKEIRIAVVAVLALKVSKLAKRVATLEKSTPIVNIDMLFFNDEKEEQGDA